MAQRRAEAELERKIRENSNVCSSVKSRSQQGKPQDKNVKL